MSGIHTAVSEIPHITRKATKEGEKLLKKMWSVMDAAAEKVPPSEVL